MDFAPADRGPKTRYFGRPEIGRVWPANGRREGPGAGAISVSRRSVWVHKTTRAERRRLEKGPPVRPRCSSAEECFRVAPSVCCRRPANAWLRGRTGGLSWPFSSRRLSATSYDEPTPADGEPGAPAQGPSRRPRPEGARCPRGPSLSVSQGRAGLDFGRCIAAGGQSLSLARPCAGRSG